MAVVNTTVKYASEFFSIIIYDNSSIKIESLIQLYSTHVQKANHAQLCQDQHTS